MTREEAIRTLEEHKIMFQHDFGWDISTIKALDMAISALSEPNNVGMSMSHRAIARVINDYVDNHRGDSDKQYTALEIKLLLISDDSDNKGERR